jgi:hypothetical protein
MPTLSVFELWHGVELLEEDEYEQKCTTKIYIIDIL